METKSSLLIIADDDLSYGINQGYYPDMTKAIDLGNLTVYPLSNIDNLKEHDIRLSAQPIGDGEDVYFRNPYDNCYVSMKDSDLLNIFVETKSYAIKEALVLMGAKDIVMKESVHDKDSQNYESNNRMGNNIAKAEINGKCVNEVSVDMTSTVESHDPNRKPKSYKEVVDFMNSHGLASDPKLRLLCERLKSDGRISGLEKYEISYCSEIAQAINIAAKIDYKLFSANLDFSSEHNHVHIIKKSLEINFG